MQELKINITEIRSAIAELSVGTKVLLSGTVYTARDAAHKRMCEMAKKGHPLPFPMKDSVIYYAGPTPTPQGQIIGSCGPTTSGRMDVYAPALLDLGLIAMIGKGQRSQPVVDAIIRNQAVYFCATGGAGALYSQCVTAVEVIAFNELGCESVKRLTIHNFPVYVGIDCLGGNIYDR